MTRESLECMQLVLAFGSDSSVLVCRSICADPSLLSAVSAFVLFMAACPPRGSVVSVVARKQMEEQALFTRRSSGVILTQGRRDGSRPSGRPRRASSPPTSTAPDKKRL